VDDTTPIAANSKGGTSIKAGGHCPQEKKGKNGRVVQLAIGFLGKKGKRRILVAWEEKIVSGFRNFRGGGLSRSITGAAD